MTVASRSSHVTATQLPRSEPVRDPVLAPAHDRLRWLRCSPACRIADVPARCPIHPSIPQPDALPTRMSAVRQTGIDLAGLSQHLPPRRGVTAKDGKPQTIARQAEAKQNARREILHQQGAVATRETLPHPRPGEGGVMDEDLPANVVGIQQHDLVAIGRGRRGGPRVLRLIPADC